MANSRVTERTKPYSISTIRKKISPKVLRPSRNNNHFEDIIGNKDIIEQLKHTIELFQAGSDISILGYRYHPSYIFLGNPGVGKTLTVYAFAKEMNLPIVTINMERLIPDHSDAVFDGIIAFLKTIGKCVVLFKEIQFITSMETKEYFPIFTSILDIKEAFPDSFFFVTASTCFTCPAYFMKNEAFDTQISFNLPDPDEREALIRKFLKDLPYVEDLDIPKLSRDFFGFTGGDIRDFLRNSYIQALTDGKEQLTYEIISQTMYSDLFGRKISKMSEKELRYTAYHEAGHVIAGYYGCPDYKISKVEVVHRSSSLGLTDPEADDKKLSNTREDILGEIRHALGGHCAELIEFDTCTSGTMQDLLQATALADGYVCKFGMDENFGPVYVDEGEFHSEYLQENADARIQELLIKIKSETKELLLKHKPKLDALAKALIDKETLYQKEIHEILEGPEDPTAETPADPKEPVKDTFKDPKDPATVTSENDQKSN